MLLVPDPTTAVVDPVLEAPTLSLIYNTYDPETGKPYRKDARWVAQKAERFLIESGIADVSYWGPEAEFFVFDDVSFEIEAEGDDSLVRTARKKRYPHVEPLEAVEGRLPSPPFFRIHRPYIVNLDRVYELRSRGDRDWEVKMDPPVNKVLPVSRRRMDELPALLGI